MGKDAAPRGMDALSFSQLRRANISRCNTAFPQKLGDWPLPYWGNALAGEVGEACNVIKKIMRGDSGPQAQRVGSEVRL